MKRKSLLFLLLMALFGPLAMMGQNRATLTVYDQNTTTNEYVPIYGYYADSKSMCEFIIPKEKISAMNGGVISAMKFYLDNSSSGSYYSDISATFNVFVKEVSATTLSGLLGQSGATTVFNSTITIAKGASNVEINIPFSSNYVYGGGNLLIGVYQTATTGYNHTYWTGEAQDTNTAWGGYNGSTSAKQFLPKTTFTYTPGTTPYISLAPSSATVLTGFTETLTASYGNVTNPTITWSSSNNNVATVSGSGTTATVTAVSAGTATITATMTYNGNTYTAQCTITVEDPSYCTPAPTSVDGSGMHPVKFGSGDYVVNNTSYPTSSPYYGDYSSQVGAYEVGETASVEMSFYTYGYSSGYNYGAVIWVDWNKDYEFSDSEIVNKGTSTTPSSSSSPGTLTLTFNIPASTAAGDYRMRIGAADSYFDSFIGGTASAAHDPCYTGSYTCFHDYTLRVVATGAYTITCATTTGGTITADKNNADENDVVTITATPETDYMLTALTYTPEGGSAQNINIATTPYTFTMPAANVTVNATFTQPNCPKPTNLSVSNLAASHATVSWDSEAGNYTVRYSTATVTGTTLDPVFEDGFEDGLGNWTTYANGTSAESTDWQQYTGTFSGGSGGPHTGSYVAMSRSWSSETGDISVDNWLVSPQMTLGNTLKFWVITSEGYPESYAVYVSTGSGVVPSSGTGDFQVVANLTPATGTWTEMTYDISAYAGQQGYVAIRHKDSSKDHLLVDDFGVYNTINTYSYGSWTTVTPNPTTESCQITGLSAETLYEVQVQANCGGTDGSSAWSTIHFTTPDNCGAPQELATSNITAATATLSWADDKDSYNLQYRKVYFHEGFESETMPAGWTTVDSNSDGLCWQIGSSTAHSGVNGVCNSSFVYDSEFSLSTTPDDYLISPQLDLQGTLRVWLSGYPRSSSNYSEHFEILLSTTGTSVSDFTTTLVTESTTTNSYVEYTADLSSYTGKGYIAIHHFNCTNQNYLYVDDFGLYGNENWVTLNPNPTTETANLTGLTPIIENDYHLLPTTYEWQVQGVNCDGNGGTTDWSAPATFTTREGFKKNIIGRTTGGYQLIASPIGDVAPANDVTNMTANNFDLYRYNANATLQWENYKQEGEHYHFNLDPGRGYLYANSETVDLVFMGAEYSGNALEVTLNAKSANGFQNWNLVGNPFAEIAHITAQGHTLNYYTVGVKDGQTNQYIPATNTSIQPMEGVFVIASVDGEKITFARGESETKSSQLALNINSSRNLVDRAIVRFDECRQLPKFQLNEDYTKVYIPMDGEEYAVVHGEEMGELPVNFKAEENGHYSLSLSSENVEFAYLHLIDNMTGNEVDLLQTPSYSFEAKTTDYASRFKLVYATGDNSNSDNFAFFSNGSFVINNDGVAELQVVDIMGRILSSETINGCSNVSVNAAPGVYMLRLVNGDNVKVQKVVVK